MENKFTHKHTLIYISGEKKRRKGATWQLITVVLSWEVQVTNQRKNL